MYNAGITDGDPGVMITMLNDFADLWERAAADQTPVDDIVGEDPVHEGTVIQHGTLAELKRLLPPARVDYVEKQPSLEDVFLALVGALFGAPVNEEPS